MKKTILSMTVALLAIIGFTVEAQAQSFRYGVEAGANISFPTDFDCTRGGFSVGGFAEMQMKKGWFGIAGLKLESKPMQYSHCYYDNIAGVSTSYGAKATPYYLTLPVNFGYRWNQGKNCALSLAAGPYASFGLFGKGQQLINDQVQPGKYEFFDSYSRFDWGVGGTLGLEIAGHYRVGVGFQKGLYNLQKYAPTIKHNVLNLTVGYKF